MTLHDEILSRPDCADALAIRDCGALAEILSAGRTKLIERNVGYGTVLDTLGADVGSAFLDALTTLAATSSPVKWALKLLDRVDLDIPDQTWTAVAAQVAAAGFFRAA